MISKSKKNMHTLSIILFAVTIILNYMSASGVLFPYTQRQISDMYSNLLAPSSLTFSIWGVIYIGALLSLIYPWRKNISKEFKDFYYDKIVPLNITWAIFNILWTITWNTDRILISLIAIILYALTLIYLVKTISSYPEFAKDNKLFITYPVGLHAGWLTFASFTNIMVLMVKNGFDAFSNTGIMITILLMILACISVLFILRKTDNSFVTVPALWALIGIVIKQRPQSDFANSNKTVMIAAIILFVLSLIAHFVILKKNKEVEY